jgi:hypothetical protein
MLLVKIVFHFNDYLDFDVETDLPDLSWAINLTWFLNLMFTTPAFIVVLGVIFWWWAYGRQGDVIVADIAGVPTDPDFVRGELVQAAYKGGLKFSYLMKTGPENIPRLFPTTTDKRDQWHREHWKEAQDLMLVSPTIQKLQNLAVFVQVGLDLSVISGLTFLAIACVTQAGVDDFFVIIAVFLWFFVIGLINHLSNVMRLMHVYLQYHPDALNDTHVKIVPITRTAVAILIAVMLFVYLRFAGPSWAHCRAQSVDFSRSRPHGYSACKMPAELLSDGKVLSLLGTRLVESSLRCLDHRHLSLRHAYSPLWCSVCRTD